jgi:hypothetical protein
LQRRRDPRRRRRGPRRRCRAALQRRRDPRRRCRAALRRRRAALRRRRDPRRRRRDPRRRRRPLRRRRVPRLQRVDLTADEIAGGAHREFSLGALPSGTYGGAEIEIQPLAAGADTSDAALADFVAAGASVLVDGTYQGKSFQFAGHFLAEQGTDGEVTVDASAPVTIAMSVDPSGWFLNGSGGAVDPSDAAQHDALAVAICTTLDTQPQLAPQASPAPTGGHPGGQGPHGNGPAAHCVEPTAP